VVRRSAWVWLLPALLGLGCGSTFSQLFSAGIPTAEVGPVELRLDSGTRGTVQFELRVANPRHLPFEVRRATWALQLRGRRVAEGVLTTAPHGWREGQALILLEAPVAFLSAPPTGLSQLELQGNITARLGDSEQTFVFGRQGMITIRAWQ